MQHRVCRSCPIHTGQTQTDTHSTRLAHPNLVLPWLCAQSCRWAREHDKRAPGERLSCVYLTPGLLIWPLLYLRVLSHTVRYGDTSTPSDLHVCTYPETFTQPSHGYWISHQLFHGYIEWGVVSERSERTGGERRPPPRGGAYATGG